MKFPVILLGAALYLFSSVEAGINTKTPFKSVTWNGGEVEQIEWNDDGKAPGLKELAISGETTIDLMAGGPNNQVSVKTIGKVLATKGEFDYDVPKDVGPPGDFYFLKYTTGKSISFSGSFTIQGVNGNIPGFDPKSPNTPNAKAAEPNAGNVTAPATPPPTNPYAAPNIPKTDPKANNSPASSPTAPAAPAPTTDLPNSLSNSAAYNFPSFAGIATAAVAFAFTYLY